MDQPAGNDAGLSSSSIHIFDGTGPDLTVSALQVGPTAGSPGSTVSVQFTVQNIGGTSSTPTQANLRIAYRGDQVHSSDPLLHTLVIPSVPAGGSVPFTVNAQIPNNRSAGVNYLWVIADVASVAGQTPDAEGNDYAKTAFTVQGTGSGPVAPLYNTAFLTNAELLDWNSMTTAQIRSFLSSRNSYFANEIADVDAVVIDPPQVFASAAQQYGINPKVLLVTLQKEQSGVTAQSRLPEQNLEDLMGCLVIDPDFATIRDQIMCSAERYRSYYDRTQTGNGATQSGWRVGVPKEAQDGITVTPANAAVAVLFTYNPLVGVQWGGNMPFGGTYLFYRYWNDFGFASNPPTDDQGPVVSIQSAPPAQVASSVASVAVSGSATDSSGVGYVLVRSNQGQWQRADGENAWSATVPVWPGLNCIELQASDQNGNLSPIEELGVERAGSSFSIHELEFRGQKSDRIAALFTTVAGKLYCLDRSDDLGSFLQASDIYVGDGSVQWMQGWSGTGDADKGFFRVREIAEDN